MSEQVKHALKQAAIVMVIAALLAFANQQTDFLQDLVGSENGILLGPIIAAAVAAGIRWLEGKRDSKRADELHMVPADVGYPMAVEMAAIPGSTAKMVGEDVYLK
jgi:hypothetical protein